MCAYVGGKCKATFVVDVLNHENFDNMDFHDVCCGYCHVLRRVRNKRSYAASDANELLMVLLLALQRRDVMPARITKERYDHLRCSGELTLEAAVACFAYSFNGKAWAGYAPTYTRRVTGRVDDQAGSRLKYYKALQDSPSFTEAHLRCTCYSMLAPKGALVYVDPPYAHSTGYRGTPAFDSEAFWARMREWSKDNVVFVSEYAVPPRLASQWVCIAQAPKRSTLAGGHKQTLKQEKLFVHADCLRTNPALAHLRPHISESYTDEGPTDAQQPDPRPPSPAPTTDHRGEEPR